MADEKIIKSIRYVRSGKMSNTYDRVSGKVMEVKQKEYEKQIRNIIIIT